MNTNGWTSSEEYSDAIARASDMQEVALQSLDSAYDRETTQLHWPFDDYEEDRGRAIAATYAVIFHDCKYQRTL